MTDRYLRQVSSVEQFEILVKKNICEGEEKLMLAVLANAVEYFQKYILTRDGRWMRQFEEAEKWFLERDSAEPFSFENICETLQLNPDYVRQGLLRWKKETLKASAASGQTLERQKSAKTRVRYQSGRLSTTV